MPPSELELWVTTPLCAADGGTGRGDQVDPLVRPPPGSRPSEGVDERVRPGNGAPLDEPGPDGLAQDDERTLLLPVPAFEVLEDLPKLRRPGGDLRPRLLVVLRDGRLLLDRVRQRLPVPRQALLLDL
jgi:hypothetical protein